jgi:hypothetical protein
VFFETSIIYYPASGNSQADFYSAAKILREGLFRYSEMLVYDDIFSWEGWGGRLRLASGKCRLRIFDLAKKKENGPAYLRPIIIVVSDIPESPMSVRSCSSHIATRVIQQFHIEPERMLFIEYYPQTTYGEHNEHVIAEKYDAVDFTWRESRAIEPKWRTLKPPLLDVIREIVQAA